MSYVTTKKLTIFDYINYSLLAIISIACVFPFIYVFSVSFTDPDVYVPLQFYFSRKNGRCLPTNIFCQRIASLTP